MERIFQCPLCENCFESKICLENHVENVHKQSNLVDLMGAAHGGESESGSVIDTQPVATSLENCDSPIEIDQKATSENDQDDFDCCGCCFGDGGEGDAEDCRSTGSGDAAGGVDDGGGGGSCD